MSPQCPHTSPFSGLHSTTIPQINQSLVPRTASIRVTDLGGCASNVVKVVVIMIVINNDPPEVTTPNVTFLYTQGQPPVPISHGVVLSDADSMFFKEVSLTLTITNALNGSEEVLSVVPVEKGSVTYVNDGPTPQLHPTAAGGGAYLTHELTLLWQH